MTIRQIILFTFFWLLSVKPEAQEIRKVKINDLEKMIMESRHPIIINFWATWCKPCVEEIPSFIREANAHKSDSLQLVLVSLDLKENYPVVIRNFIHSRNFQGLFFWLDETNADYFCPKIDSAWSGAIPASLFINKKTGYRAFYESKLTDEQLSKVLQELFKSPTGDQ